MELTFQFPMQYCSLQHQTLLPSPVTSITGCCFCFGSVSSFFLDLFIQSPPVAYRAPTNLGSSSFCFFIVFMGLMGGAVFPFYYLTSAQTMVEIMEIMVTSFKRSSAGTAVLSASNPEAGHHLPTPHQRLLDTQENVWVTLLWGLGLVGLNQSLVARLGQYLALDSIVIFTMLILSIQEYGISHHLFMSFLISFISLL